MSCLIKRSKGQLKRVMAANGEDSLLYRDILNSLTDDYEPSEQVILAKEAGKIRDFSNAEIALALWSQSYTEPNIKERIEQQGKTFLDKNGEPVLNSISDLLGLKRNEGEGKAAKRIDMDGVIRFLRQQKLIYKKNGTFRLSEDDTLPDKNLFKRVGDEVATNEQRIRQALTWFGLPERVVSFKKTDAGTVLTFNATHLPALHATKRQDDSNANGLINFLRDRFPQLTIEFVSERKAKDLYNEYQQKLDEEKRGKLDFDRVNSFIHKGTVYLINERVNDHVAIEEVLHPFIYTVSKNNPELFNSLKAAALKEFPNLHETIEANYSAAAGFTDNDREQELVTQAVAKTFAKEYEAQPPRTILKLLTQLREWFAKLVENFGLFVGVNNHTVVDVRKLPSDIALTGIAQLLNTYDSKFLVDTTAPGFNFSLTAEEDAVYARLKKKANSLQRKILEDLLEKHNKVREMQLNNTYLAENGAAYTSLTKAISGKFDDKDKEDEGRSMSLIFGNEFDTIMEGLALDKPFDVIKKELTLQDDVAIRAYREIQQYLYGLKTDGSIIVPQLRVIDPKSGISGMLDLLLIRPNGSMMVIDLKTSSKSVFKKEYYSKKYATKEGSRLPGENFSKAQTHGLQVGGYKKLMEVNGYYVDQIRTYHILLKIDESEAKPKVIDFVAEGPLDHSFLANKEYIDKMIPTQSENDKVRKYKNGFDLLSDATKAELDEWDAEDKESQDYKNTMQSLTVAMNEFREKARKRIDRLQMIKNAASFSSAQDSIHKLSELLMLMGQEMSRGQADRAFGSFLNHARTELTGLIDYMSKSSNHDSEDFIRRVLDAGSYIETYRGMVYAPEWAMGNKYQAAMRNDVLNLLNVAKTNVDISLRNYIFKVMRGNSTREISDEEWRNLIQEGIDISRADFHLGDIDTSSDPLVAVAAKLYKQAMLESHTRASDFKERIYEMGNQLAKVFGGKVDFKKWLIELDENGKVTGRYVQEIGAQFWKLRDTILDKLRGSDGKIMQYRKVYVEDSIKSDDDMAYNKILMKLKKEYQEFQQGEIQREDGFEDGKYYKYSQEYKDEREKFEVYKPIMVDDKFIRGSWEKRDDIDIDDEAYRQYQAKYYNIMEGYDTPYYVDGEFTGEFQKGTGYGRFVKNDYIEIRPIAGDNTDMRSKQWLQLQNPTDEKGRVMKAFYDFFIKEMKITLQMLPISTEKQMLGELPRVQGNFIERAKQSVSFFKAAARTVGNWFNVRTQAKESLYNEDGSPMNSLPVFYKGSLRDEILVEGLKQSLEQLERSKKENTIKKEEYATEKARLLNELRIALSAVAADELETDMVKSLLEFRSKAESFKAMHDIEASLLAVQEILKQRKYKRKLISGEFETERTSGRLRWVQGADSRTLERFKEWMQMTFYHSEDIDIGKADVFADKLMKVASMSSVGVGSFGSVHNYVMARINTAIETWGGRFYDKSAGIRAVKEFNTDFLTGLFRSDPGHQDVYYKTKRGRSKYEALVNLYNITRKHESGEGNPSDFTTYLFYGYKLSEMGEFAAQSKSGIAYLMTQKVKNAEGKEISVYDAYDYDEKTGKLSVKEGYEDALNDKQRHIYTNAMWEMNKQMHGSYAWEDRMVIQKYTLGKLAVQFHKWVYPMYKARFQPRYYDENLGWMEGRYNTVLTFLNHLRKLDGSIKEKAYGAWGKLTKDQVQNMLRNFAELGFLLTMWATYAVLKGIADGLSPDDDKLKRWINFLRWEESKDIMEIKFWIPGVGFSDQVEMIKNPFAATSTFNRFSSVLSEAADVAWPFNNNGIYYTAGPYKGQLKLGKKFTDLLPIFKEYNRIKSFSQLSSFKIQ